MIYCCNCKKEVNANLVSGSLVYPNRPDLYKLLFYQCPHCNSFVGTHKDSNKPLGCIPTEEIKLARQNIHKKLDPIWKSGKISRTLLYDKISSRLGYKYHTAEIKDMKEANKILCIINSITKELQND